MQKREHEFGRRWNDTWQVEDIKTSTMRAPVEPNRTPEGLHSWLNFCNRFYSNLFLSVFVFYCCNLFCDFAFACLKNLVLLYM